jgi:hypothetical protein
MIIYILVYRPDEILTNKIASEANLWIWLTVAKYKNDGRSSFPPVVCMRAHVLFVFVFV